MSATMRVFRHDGGRVCVHRRGLHVQNQTKWFFRSDLGAWMPCLAGHVEKGVIEVPADDEAERIALNRAFDEISRRIRDEVINIDGDGPWAERARGDLAVVEGVRAELVGGR